MILDLEHEKLVQILLDNNADIHSRSTTGKEPRDYALTRRMYFFFFKN